MKYLNKSFSSTPNTKAYRDNWGLIFNNEHEVEIEMSEKIEEFIKQYAKENHISFNDAVAEILKSELERLKDLERLRDEEMLARLKDKEILARLKDEKVGENNEDK